MINGRTGINGDANSPNKQTKIKIINKAKSLSFERKKNGMGVKLLKRIRKS